MSLRTSSLLRLGLGTALLVAAPAACIYPDYSFNEPEPTGGGGNTSSSNTSASGGNMPTSSGTGGSGGGTGGSGGSSGENCLNGKDDDDDSLVDCEDTDCGAYACVTSIPFGWSGYAALFEGVPAQEPACPGIFPSMLPYKGNRTPVVTPHSCSACSCGTPTGQTCDLPDAITIWNKPCGQTGTVYGTLTVPANWDGACYGVSGYPGGKTDCDGLPCNTSVTSTAPTVTGGSCTPDGGVPTKPAVDWAILGKACGDAPSGGGCGAGSVCQPQPQAPFLSGLCIYKGGENACPAGDFSAQHIFYEGFDDARTCSTCQCGAPAGSTCKATISVFSDQTVNTCKTQAGTFEAGQCTNIAGNPTVASRSAVLEPPSGGSCAVAGGGQPTGTVTPTNATTFCCVP